MTYKTGEVPQAQDEISGTVEGKAARGRVLAVRANGDVLITRRATYSGTSKPLVAEHLEVPSDSLSLVYRPNRANVPAAPAASPAAAGGATAAGSSKAGKKAAAKPEAAKK